MHFLPPTDPLLLLPITSNGPLLCSQDIHNDMLGLTDTAVRSSERPLSLSHLHVTSVGLVPIYFKQSLALQFWSQSQR